MKNIFIVFVCTLISNSVFGQNAQEISVLGPTEYEQEISAKGVQLIDVRTPEEFSQGHIPGARNINFFSEDFLENFKELDKTEPIYIYCRSGNRSSKASAKLTEAGFGAIIDLKGGYKAWTAAKKPTSEVPASPALKK